MLTPRILGGAPSPRAAVMLWLTQICPRKAHPQARPTTPS